MAGKSSKAVQADQKSKTFEEFEDDEEVFEEDIPELDIKEPVSSQRSRDWRDVERLRELRELKKLMGDDDFDNPLKNDLTGDAHPRSGKKKRTTNDGQASARLNGGCSTVGPAASIRVEVR